MSRIQKRLCHFPDLHAMEWKTEVNTNMLKWFDRAYSLVTQDLQARVGFLESAENLYDDYGGKKKAFGIKVLVDKPLHSCYFGTSDRELQLTFKNCLLQLVVMSKTLGGSLIVPDYLFFKLQDDFLEILNFCRNHQCPNKALKLCNELIELLLHCAKAYQDQEHLPLLDRFLSKLLPNPPAKWLPYLIDHTKRLRVHGFLLNDHQPLIRILSWTYASKQDVHKCREIIDFCVSMMSQSGYGKYRRDVTQYLRANPHTTGYNLPHRSQSRRLDELDHAHYYQFTPVHFMPLHIHKFLPKSLALFLTHDLHYTKFGSSVAPTV